MYERFFILFILPVEIDRKTFDELEANKKGEFMTFPYANYTIFRKKTIVITY
ncbi:hypothetical protein J6TS2_04780 [Heyndrickxia sporothermodurans]|nr:hypothetical protein J6TS2_04780 [Heyndrickxia sporothermodurans]